MAKLDALARMGGLRKRIEQYKQGVEVNPRDLRPLLTELQWEEMELELKRQKSLKKQRRPERLAAYEEQHRQCAVLLAKCKKSQHETDKQIKAKLALQKLCREALRRAYGTACKYLNDDEAQRWMDRIYGDAVEDSFIDEKTSSAVIWNEKHLEAFYSRCPIIVSSASADKKCTQAERFGWMTISEVRCKQLEKAYTELDVGLDAVLEQEMFKAEVRSAKIFLDAYFTRIDELTDGWGTADASQQASAMSMANRALQQAGYRPVNRSVRGLSRRDIEIQEMEDALRRRFEAEMTEEEREQLEMAREMDLDAERRRKGRR